MPAESEVADRGSLVRRGSRSAATPKQHRNAADGNHDEKRAAAIAASVAIGRDHVRREQYQGRASQGNVRRLEVAMAAP